MKANEHDDVATPRAGGDVLIKSASHAAPGESPDNKANTASSEDSETETRAGGDVLIKGASQKQTEDNK